MSNIQPYIILNDIDSRTISGLLISSLPPISKPLQRTQVETVDGRDGDLVTPLGFSAYDKVITIGLTYGYDIDDVIEYFNSEGVVVFSNEPDKFYRYAIYEQIDFERLIRFKTAEVTLHCQPFKFSTTEDPKLFNVVSGQSITVKNNGNIYSRPDITVIGSGEVDLSLNGSQILSLDLSDNQAVIIDAEDMNAYAAQSAIREVVVDIQAKQAGSGDPSPSNIREISGFNGATIVRCGVNLLNINNFVQRSGYTNLSASISGSDISISGYTSGGRFACFYAFTEIGKTYTVKFTNSTGIVDCRVQFSDTEPTEWISGGTTFFANKTLTFTSTKTWCMLWFELNADATITELQLEQGSTATAYKSFIGSKYARYFEGLLNGSYGFVDLGTLSWSTYQFVQGVITFYANLPLKKVGSSSSSVNGLCEKYNVIPTPISQAALPNDSIIVGSSSTYIYINDDDYTDAATFTEAVSGKYLIYELATPTTPTITQEEITTLLSAFDDTLISTVFGQTVYGGVLDVTNGVLRITHGYQDLGDLTWTYAIDINRFYSNEQITIKHPASTSEIPFILCSRYQTLSWDNFQVASNDYCISNPNSNGRINIRDTQYTDATTFKTAMSGVQLVYELATPTIVQLTPAQVNNLLGVNTLYADTGNITVSHKSNGVIVTDTGSIVSFSAGLDDMEKGALLNRLVTGDYDKIRLRKGVNTFVLTGNARQFVIDKYSRWI